MRNAVALALSGAAVLATLGTTLLGHVTGRPLLLGWFFVLLAALGALAVSRGARVPAGALAVVLVGMGVAAAFTHEGAGAVVAGLLVGAAAAIVESRGDAGRETVAS